MEARFLGKSAWIFFEEIAAIIALTDAIFSKWHIICEICHFELTSDHNLSGTLDFVGQKLRKFCTNSPLYSSRFLALASLYIKKQNNMQAAVNKRAYFGKTAPILLRPRLLNQYFNEKSIKRSCHVKVRVFSMTGYFPN